MLAVNQYGYNDRVLLMVADYLTLSDINAELPEELGAILGGDTSTVVTASAHNGIGIAADGIRYDMACSPDRWLLVDFCITSCHTL